MIRFLVVLYLLIPISESYSEEATFRRVINCLGNEEAYIHKNRISNSQYFLNQEIINSITQLQDAIFTAQDVDEICSRVKHASLTLLKKTLNIKKEMLEPNLKNAPDITFHARVSIENFISDAPEIFINYLMRIQSEMPTPNCFDKYLPGFTKIKEEIKYLNDIRSISDIVFKDNRYQKILDKLKNKDQIISKCTKDYEKKLKETPIEKI